MELFDTHAHLNDEQFDAMLPDVIERSRNSGVTRINVVGTNLADSIRAVKIAEEFEGVFATVGIQPNYVSEADEADFGEVVELSNHPSVIAVGETGLDRYWDRAPFEMQKEYFTKHIELSLQSNKPFVVHMRECGADVIDTFNSFAGHAPLRGVMHSFTGDSALAAKCLEFGMYISFAGMVTYKKSDELRSVAASVPLDRLLIETDCPYLSPHPHRGQRPNEPALVRHTADCLADLKKISIDEFAKATTNNAVRLFGIN